jgi:hypothetical protein
MEDASLFSIGITFNLSLLLEYYTEAGAPVEYYLVVSTIVLVNLIVLSLFCYFLGLEIKKLGLRLAANNPARFGWIADINAKVSAVLARWRIEKMTVKLAETKADITRVHLRYKVLTQACHQIETLYGQLREDGDGDGDDGASHAIWGDPVAEEKQKKRKRKERNHGGAPLAPRVTTTTRRKREKQLLQLVAQYRLYVATSPARF